MATICPIDGVKVGTFSGWTLKDGEICKHCGEMVGFKHGDDSSESAAHSYKVEEIKKLIADNHQYDPDHVKVVNELAYQQAKDNSYAELSKKYYAQNNNKLSPDDYNKLGSAIQQIGCGLGCWLPLLAIIIFGLIAIF